MAEDLNPDGTVSYGDNSFLILLYSVLSIIIILAFYSCMENECQG